MAFNGFFKYDGSEVINSERTEALVASRPWFRALPELDTKPNTLSQMYPSSLGYADVTDAPWYDPDIPASRKFFGAYPLDVSGIDQSTRNSTPFEGAESGGTPGRIRHGIRAVVFSVALMAENEAGAKYGMDWLKRALLGSLNSTALTDKIASGLTMDYLSSKPDLNEIGTSPIERVQTLGRRMKKVAITNGPNDPFKRELKCGGQVWVTGFTATVGNPFEIGPDRLIFTNMPNAVAYGPGVALGVATGPTVYNEVDCSHTFLEPFFDPLCAVYIDPPQPPSVPLGCYAVPTTWNRFRASIPASEVPAWGQVVPTVNIFTTVVQRGIRIRFYEDTDGDLDVTESPCNYVGDMLVSYIPAGATLRLDGVSETIVISTQNGLQRADSLAFGTDSKPFIWPSLTRGNPWVMVVDFDPATTTTRPSISLTLTPRGV